MFAYSQCLIDMGGLMRHNPTVIARLRPDRSGGTWGIFLPDEDRWLELLFDREREARHFAKDLMLAASKA